MRLVVKLLVICFAISSLHSCVSKKKYDELTAAKEATDQALAQTQEQVKSLQGDVENMKSEMESQKSSYESQIAGINDDLKAKDSKIAQVEGELKTTQGELQRIKDEINGVFNTYTESGLSLEERDGDLYVVTGAPVNYRSGSTSLNRAQRDAIDALAETLKNNPDVKILVEGHTDDKKLVEGAAYADNWELSAARAVKVVQRLVRKGVSPNQLSAAGRADSSPVAGNDSRDGRSKNRRSAVKTNTSMGKLKEIVNQN